MDPNTDFRTVFAALPGASGLIKPNAPEFTVVAATAEFAAFAGVSAQEMLGKSLFRYFPDNPKAGNVSGDIRESLARCMASRKTNELAVQRYDIANADGTFFEMYWKVTHSPVLDASGEISYIIHTAVDVTDRVQSSLKDDKIRLYEPAHKLFSQIAMCIYILKGSDLLLEQANDPALHLLNDPTLLKKPLREILPASLRESYAAMVERVRLTGIPFQAQNVSLEVQNNGQPQKRYFNFMAQPYYTDDILLPTGVIIIVNEVTQLVEDQKALQEKERSLSLAAEIGDLGMFTIDLQEQRISISPQISHWLGLEDHVFGMQELLQKILPQDQRLVKTTIASILQGPELPKHDLTFRARQPKSGKVQYLRSIGQVQYENGQAVSLSGIIQDISPAVKIQRDLEQAVEKLRSIVQSSPFPIAVYTGREMRIDMVNKKLLDTWFKSEEVIGKTFSEALPELEGLGFYEQLLGVYESGKAYHAYRKKVVFKSDGVLKPFYFNYSYTPLFNKKNEVYGVMNTAADVTDLVLAQKGLAESEENLRRIILQAPVAMCLMTGREHVIEVANDSMLALWGKPKEMVIGQPVFVALPDARDQGLEILLSGVFASGETFTASEMPVTLIRNGKEELVYQNFVYEPYRDPSGEIVGILSATIDVTQQVVARQDIEKVVRQRTAEIEQAKERLEKSNAELKQFAYIASHDLQEPLRKITMFSGLLKDSIENPDERTAKILQNINTSAGRMMNLIRDILGYSQLSNDGTAFKKTNLETVFAEALSDLDLIVEEKKAVIVQTGLPVIEAIPLQMLQLFHNLISNALKYSRLEMPPQINISGATLAPAEAYELGLPKNAAGYCKIVFRDNGIGFEQEYADRIFNIFQRLHGKKEYEGTGIGLAMCKKIAENHLGIIYALGHEGQGAEFVVVLPQKQ